MRPDCPQLRVQRLEAAKLLAVECFVLAERHHDTVDRDARLTRELLHEGDGFAVGDTDTPKTGIDADVNLDGRGRRVRPPATDPHRLAYRPSA